MRATLPLLFLSGAMALLHGQAMVEYGATAGSAAAAGAGAGKSVKNVFGQVNKVLSGAAKADESAPTPPGSSSLTAASSSTGSPAPAAPVVPADFREVVAGMDKADLIRKAGKPSMSVTSMESSALVETCWYRAGEDKVTVILRNGKVATISGWDKSSAK